MASPQFIGQPVNEAYHSLIEVTDGKIRIKDKARFRRIFERFVQTCTDENIDLIIEQAGYPDGRRSVVYLESVTGELEKEIKKMLPGTSDHKKTKEAIETYKKVIEAGGESSYLKMALKQRKDDMIVMFRDLGFQDYQ